MPEQIELIAGKAPRVSAEEVSLLLAQLDQRAWVPATMICAELNWSDRKIRAVASASEGQIISGQNGYKLTSQATVEEIQRASNWLRHQAKEMTHRALEIDRVYHRKLRPDAAQTT